MAGFNYYGKSTEDIIDTPLILVTNESIDSVVGVARTKLQGEPTISRPIVNEYGTLNEHLTFTYSLMKQDGETFTEEEQRTVERWLTSPKFSSELTVTDCEGNEYIYYGLFTNTQWVIGNGDFMLCTFTFETNGSYPLRKYTVERTAKMYDAEGNIIGIGDAYTIMFDCESDELEEYIYPKLTVVSTEQDQGNTTSFSMYNANDQGKNRTFQITSRTPQPIYIDNEHCIVQRLINTEHVNLRYKDIGWDTLDTINWFRLVPGENQISVSGSVDIKLEYTVPFKKVGGWLI